MHRQAVWHALAVDVARERRQQRLPTAMDVEDRARTRPRQHLVDHSTSQPHHPAADRQPGHRHPPDRLRRDILRGRATIGQQHQARIVPGGALLAHQLARDVVHAIGRTRVVVAARHDEVPDVQPVSVARLMHRP